jgi:hypothetical protein
VKTMDNVTNQKHYENKKIEPIDLMIANNTKEKFIGFLENNILKYLMRYESKDGLKDLKKCWVYLTWLILYISTGKIDKNIDNIIEDLISKNKEN